MKVRSMNRVFCFVMLVAMTACLGCYDAKLPDALKVKMPEGAAMEAPIDSGPLLFADSTWAVYEVEDETKADGAQEGAPPQVLVRIEFGPRGEIIRAFDNRSFGVEHIGNEMIADGGQHPTPIPATSYVAESYGGGTKARFGFTAMGKYFIGPVEAAVASAYAFGSVDETGDRFVGTMGYTIDVNPTMEAVLADIVGSKTDERPVFAIRE